MASACFLLIFQWAKADIKNPADLDRSPIPQPGRVTVARGESVEITLNALTASNGEILFLLRSQPAEGRLAETEPSHKTKTSAVVHYQSNAQSTASADSFKYAVRLEGGAVSPAETVQISIVDLKPQIEVQAVLDAGKVGIGRQVSLPLTLKNTGSAPFNQSMLMPPGWLWENGVDKISIPAGKSLTLKLIYRPVSIGSTEGLISFGIGPKTELTLRGTALPPVEVPGVVSLKWNAETLRRELSLPLKNPSSEAMDIKFESLDGKLQHPEELILAPLEEKPMLLVLNEPPSTSFRQSLAMTVLGVVQLIEVTAEPAPAQVRVDGAGENGVINFGTVRPDQIPTMAREIKLRNPGGTSVTLFGNAPSGFTITNFENGMALLPGSETVCRIQIKAGAAGKLRNVLQWTWDKNPITLDLKAEISRDAAPAAASVNVPQNTTPSPQSSLDSDEPALVDRAAEENLVNILPPGMVMDSRIPVIARDTIYQKSETKDSVTIAWPLIPGDKYEYHVLERVVGNINGFPRLLWPPARNCTVTTQGNEGIAVIKGLEPGWQQALRITAQAPTGKCSKPSVPVTFILLPAEPFNITPWLLTLLAIALTLYWIHWRKKNAPLPRSYRSMIGEP